jgi:hypothetical protein
MWCQVGQCQLREKKAPIFLIVLLPDYTILMWCQVGQCQLREKKAPIFLIVLLPTNFSHR